MEPNVELSVTRGKNWYTSVGISVGLGVLVAAVTYVAQSLSFEDGFYQTTATAIPPKED